MRCACGAEFTPWRPEQLTCSRKCGAKRLAQRLGKAFFRAKAMRRWSKDKAA